jgi:hypothetical protein
VSYVLALIILGFIWFCVFVFYAVVIFFEDAKFGRYCWQIALIAGLYMSTALPVVLIFDAFKNPRDPFSRLRYGRRSKAK